MDEKNELNDILIRNADSTKSGNMKNILLFTAISLLMLFVGIIAFKMISSDESKSLQQTTVLPPKPPKIEQKPLFEDIPVQKNENRLDAAIAKLKQQNLEKEDTIEIKSEHISNLPPTTEDDLDLDSIDAKKIPEPIIEKKVNVKKVKSIKYYIQVASLSKNSKPDKKLVALIKGNGLNLAIRPTRVKGKIYNRIYIGPYNSRKETLKALKIIREKIVPEAFIQRVKE